MRTFLFALAAVTMAAAPAFAAQPAAPAPDKLYTSAAEVQALMDKAKADVAAKPTPNLAQNLLRFPPYAPNLEYRTSVGPAAIHETRAEVFHVVQGGGTLVTGGQLVNQERSDPENLRGTAIDGGRSQAVAAGDFFVVPEGTPHWFSEIKGTLVMMSLYVPRPAPAR